MIRVTRTIALDESELSFEFIRSSGPGGQNVNKVATAVQLRFDAANSPSISDEVRRRLLDLAGRRVSKAGVIVITAQRYRTQEQNKADAVERLVALIEQASHRPKSRRRTRPTKASVERRLSEKKRRADRKRSRSRVSDD